MNTQYVHYSVPKIQLLHILLYAEVHGMLYSGTQEYHPMPISLIRPEHQGPIPWILVLMFPKQGQGNGIGRTEQLKPFLAFSLDNG